MKTILSYVLLLLTFVVFAFVSKSSAQEDTSLEYMVRLIYFLPKDRQPQPDIDTNLDTLIKDVQQFYADEMERHGFGRKTFKFETNRTGKAIVHHVRGKFNDAYYHNPSWRVWEELKEHFDRSKGDLPCCSGYQY